VIHEHSMHLCMDVVHHHHIEAAYPPKLDLIEIRLRISSWTRLETRVLTAGRSRSRLFVLI